MNAKRVNFRDYVEHQRAEHGIPVDLDDGVSIVIPPVLLWPDEAFDARDAGDVDRAVSLVLGDEQAARFRASGGTWRILGALIRDHQGATVGESGASSTT